MAWVGYSTGKEYRLDTWVNEAPIIDAEVKPEKVYIFKNFTL